DLQGARADREIHCLERVRVFEPAFTASICVSFIPLLSGRAGSVDEDVVIHMGETVCHGILHLWVVPDCLYITTHQGLVFQTGQRSGMKIARLFVYSAAIILLLTA